MSYTDFNSTVFGGSNYTNINTSNYSQNNMSSPYTSFNGSIFDTDAGYQSVLDDYDAQIAELQAKQAEEEKKAAEEKKKAEEEKKTEEKDSSGSTTGTDETDGDDTKVDGEDTKIDGEDTKADGEDTKADGEDTKADGEDTKADGEENTETEEPPIEYSDEQLILIHNTAEDILDATTRYKYGPFGGTDEKAFIDALKNPDVTPEILLGVQAELQAQGHDLFKLIRSETSGGTEDVLEGYALAKLGGESKESNTKLESYSKYQNMDKNSVEYKKYIRTCVSLFKESVNGWGTDEKVLAYILSLPNNILSDVKAQYGDGFDERAKGEISGTLYDEFYG